MNRFLAVFSRKNRENYIYLIFTEAEVHPIFLFDKFGYSTLPETFCTSLPPSLEFHRYYLLIPLVLSLIITSSCKTHYALMKCSILIVLCIC